MTDNSPEYFERLEQLFGDGRHVEGAKICDALRAAAALARENAELLLDRDAVREYLEEIRKHFGWQNEPRDGLSKKILERIKSAESANRALQDEVDRLNRAVEMKDKTMRYVLPCASYPGACTTCAQRLRDGIAYTGTEPQDGG